MSAANYKVIELIVFSYQFKPKGGCAVREP